MNDNQSKISIAPVQTATSTQNIIRSMGSFKKRPIVSRFPNLAYQSQPLDSDGIGMDTGADDEPYSSSSEIARPYQRLAQLHYKATTERASSVTKRLQQETATEPGLPKLKDYENGAHNDRERVSTTQTISSEGYVPGVFLTSEPDHRSTIDIKEHIAYPPDYMSSDLEQSMKSGYEPVELASSKRKLGAFLASDEWSTIDDFSVQETKSTTRGLFNLNSIRIQRLHCDNICYRRVVGPTRQDQTHQGRVLRWSI